MTATLALLALACADVAAEPVAPRYTVVIRLSYTDAALIAQLYGGRVVGGVYSPNRLARGRWRSGYRHRIGTRSSAAERQARERRFGRSSTIRRLR